MTIRPSAFALMFGFALTLGCASTPEQSEEPMAAEPAAETAAADEMNEAPAASTAETAPAAMTEETAAADDM